MNQNEFFEYMNLLTPVLEEYAKLQNTTIEELKLTVITLEDTGLFNYKENTNHVYKIFKNNNIKTLKDLFEKINNNELNYGKNEEKINHNYYIHNEINGIISLIKYKYLGIIPSNLNHFLNYQINTSEQFKKVDEFYKILKSCGFNQSSTKILIDIAYEENINNITLSEFLSNLQQEQINKKFNKIPQELKPFLNIINILIDYSKNYLENKPTLQK